MIGANIRAVICADISAVIGADMTSFLGEVNSSFNPAACGNLTEEYIEVGKHGCYGTLITNPTRILLTGNKGNIYMINAFFIDCFNKPELLLNLKQQTLCEGLLRIHTFPSEKA